MPCAHFFYGINEACAQVPQVVSVSWKQMTDVWFQHLLLGNVALGCWCRKGVVASPEQLS